MHFPAVLLLDHERVTRWVRRGPALMESTAVLRSSTEDYPVPFDPVGRPRPLARQAAPRTDFVRYGQRAPMRAARCCPASGTRVSGSSLGARRSSIEIITYE